LLILERFGGY